MAVTGFCTHSLTVLTVLAQHEETAQLGLHP